MIRKMVPTIEPYRRLAAAMLAAVVAIATGCGDDSSPARGDGSDGDTDNDEDLEPLGGAPFAGLYSRMHVPVFELTLPPESIAGIGADPFTYQPGDLRYRRGDDPTDEIVVHDVGIRLKGMASFQDLGGKAAFKVKFDEFVDGQRLLGLRRLTLNNMIQDPSMVRERLGYLLFRRAGVPAPLCNHARVYVNGEYYGLYANLQTLDDEFVEWLFDPAPGNLFDQPNEQYFVDLEPGSEYLFELETNQDQADISDLVALIAAVNGPIESFVEDAEGMLDLDEVLALGGVQAVVADWDGYFGARNNYKLYHELGRDRFVIFPWGIDQIMGIADGGYIHYGYAIDGSTSNRENGLVFERCKQVDACFERYLDAVADALAVWDETPLLDEIELIYDQIADAAYEDPRKPYTNDDFEYGLDRVREFVGQRGADVAAQLEQWGYE